MDSRTRRPIAARGRAKFAGSPAVPAVELRERLGGAELAASEFRAAARRFPVRFTRYYLDLADPSDAADPLRRIAFPASSELVPDPLDRADPVGERRVSPLPFVVRKHRDRAVLLVSSRCHVYCRFCFRRSFPQGGHRDPTPDELARAVDYLLHDPELREVILSGGDPLVLPDDELRRLVGTLSGGRHLTALRVHTRAPVHDPARVTPQLAAALAAGLPCRVVLHFDHPREVTAEALGAARRLRDAGLPLLNQSVLLAGVNDDAAVLETLCRALARGGIEPYYLHHPDRVPGAAGFYVRIERGLAIYRELRARLGTGAALPAYVIDLPDGSGKVPVERLHEIAPALAAEP